MGIFGGGKNTSQNSSADPNPEPVQQTDPELVRQPPQASATGETRYVPMVQGQHPMTDSEISDMLGGENE